MNLHPIGIPTPALLVFAACAATPPAPDPVAANLREFAHVNCLYWYAEARGWDSSDFRAVAGGLVELGESTAETYRQVAEAVHDWHPDLETKQGIDPLLLRCFHLDQNTALEALITDSRGN